MNYIYYRPPQGNVVWNMGKGFLLNRNMHKKELTMQRMMYDDTKKNMPVYMCANDLCTHCHPSATFHTVPTSF